MMRGCGFYCILSNVSAVGTFCLCLLNEHQIVQLFLRYHSGVIGFVVCCCCCCFGVRLEVLIALLA